jgi:predicted TIM-barrel fold metal-dependent hydrolase
MIIDVHYHLQEQMESVETLLSHMERYKINRVALMPPLNTPFKIDWLTTTSTSPFQKTLNSRWQKVGLIIYKATVSNEGKYRIGARQYPIYDTPDNESVAQAIRVRPDKFVGWIAVNPNMGNPIEELEKRACEPGWIGVKTHPFMYRHPVVKLDEAAAYCAERGWPMLMHLGADRERGDYRYLPERHPKLKIIYAHAGLPFFRDLWDYARDRKNIFVDFSPSLLDESIKQGALKALGPERCLYGSDSPYGYPDAEGRHDYPRVMNSILRMQISDGDTERILGGNFREMVGI